MRGAILCEVVGARLIREYLEMSENRVTRGVVHGHVDLIDVHEAVGVHAHHRAEQEILAHRILHRLGVVEHAKERVLVRRSPNAHVLSNHSHR